MGCKDPQGLRPSQGGQPTPENPIGLGGGAPDLGGLVGQPKRALCAKDRKSKRKEKREVGRERRTPLSNPSWTRIGGGLLLPLVRSPWGSLSLKASLPSLLLYIWSN